MKDTSFFRVSTAAIPQKDRAEYTRVVFGRQFMRVELEEMPDIPLHVDVTLRTFPGLRIIKGTVDGVKSSRTSTLMSDGNDDIFLTLNQTGSFQMIQRGHDVRLEAGDAQISSCADRFTYLRPKGFALGLSMPRKELATRVPHLDERLGNKIPRGFPALELLKAYISFLDSGSITPQIEQLAISHIYDLAALAIGAKYDAGSHTTSVSAARLHAVKKFVLANLTNAGFGIGDVASWQCITARQVQRLFERENTTFSEFVLRHRLAHVYLAFEDPKRRHQTVGEIAFDSGFGDISNFNRSFRRRYGATPSEVRNKALMSD